MATEWHYSRDGIRLGPVSTNRLRELANSGELLPTDLVWREGLGQWAPAAKVQGLFPAISSAPPPLPPNSHVASVSPQAAPRAPEKDRSVDQLAAGWKAVIARRKSQVVLIEHANGLGTGLLVSSDGLVITNKHVVEDATFVQVCFANNTATKGLVLHLHPNADLALVKAAVRDADYLEIAKDTTDSVEAGDEVVAIGHPHGLRFTSTRGIVSVVRQRIGGDYYLQHDVAINPGNSGGPLLDSSGKLVGINTLTRRDSQGLCFAIPSGVVQTYLEMVRAAIADASFKVPTDDEIREGDAPITPEDALHAAVISFQGEKEDLKGGGYVLRTPEGYRIGVWIREETLECMSMVAELDEYAKEDPGFLLYLLETNYQLGQAKFCIDAKSSLWLVARRFVDGMDAVEVYSVIASVAFAVSKYQKAVDDFLSE